MSAVEIIARAASYDQLREMLIARRKQLGLSQLDVDDISGLQTGYTGKIEALCKKMGPLSLTLLLGALKVELALVHSAAPKPNTHASSADYGTIRKDHHREIGRKGGINSMARKTAKQRREFARMGSRKRWANWREAKALQEAKAKRMARRNPSDGGV